MPKLFSKARERVVNATTTKYIAGHDAQKHDNGPFIWRPLSVGWKQNFPNTLIDGMVSALAFSFLRCSFNFRYLSANNVTLVSIFIRLHRIGRNWGLGIELLQYFTLIIFINPNLLIYLRMYNRCLKGWLNSFLEKYCM